MSINSHVIMWAGLATAGVRTDGSARDVLKVKGVNIIDSD